VEHSAIARAAAAEDFETHRHVCTDEEPAARAGKGDLCLEAGSLCAN
jgi:hypothetical protein